MKTVASITLANIDDKTLCQDSSTLFYVALKSNRIILEFNLIPYEIMKFELIHELLTTHSSNDIICSNILFIFSMVIFYTKDFEISESEIKLVLKSDIFETIRSIIKRTKSGNVVNRCLEVLGNMKSKGKRILIYFYFDHYLFVA